MRRIERTFANQDGAGGGDFARWVSLGSDEWPDYGDERHSTLTKREAVRQEKGV